MKTSDLIFHFKSIIALADFLEVSRDSIYKWGNNVPELRQYEIEVKTGGLIKSDYTVNKEKSNGNNQRT